MNHETVQNAVDARLIAMEIPEDLAQRVVSGALPASKRKKAPFRRALAIAAVFCVVAVCSVSVLAVSFGGADRLFSIVSTEIATLLQPIEASCTDNGVEMEVLAALHDDDMVILYLSLHDVTGAGRIDATTQLNNIQFSGLFSSSFSEMVDYNAESATAIYRVSGNGGENLDGKKMTVELDAFLSGYNRTGIVDTGCTVADVIAVNPAAQIQSNVAVHSAQASGTNDAEIDALAKAPVLALSQLPAFHSDAFSWADLTAAGVYDDTLHIQLTPRGQTGPYAQANLLLLDPEGNPYDTAQGILSFGRETKIGLDDLYEFNEYLVALPADVSVDELHIAVQSETYRSITRGTWRTAFVLNGIGATKETACDLVVNGLPVNRIIVSSIGLTMYGAASDSSQAEQAPPSEIQVALHDGTFLDFNGSSASFDNTQVVRKMMFTLPVDINDIASIIIDGTTLEFS